MKLSIACFIGGIFLYSIFNLQQKANRHYFKNEFHFEKITHIEPRLVNFEDTIPNDTIYICFTVNEYPYAFYREVFTPVCLDRMCLPVWVVLYWSPGGSYLGYTIRNDGILTRDKHVPFNEEDYRKLHHLLADSRSLLKNYPVSDLVSHDQQLLEADKTNFKQIRNAEDTIKVDGVSSATAPNIENYIVKGAAYTTYTLWHTVYGPTCDSIKQITSKYLTLPFLESLIYSPFIEDNYYALDILSQGEFLATKSFIPALERFIVADDYSLRENSIDALVFSGLPDSLIQKSLVKVFQGSSYETKIRILRILNTYSHLSANSVEELTDDLPGESVQIIRKILDLLDNSNEPDLASRMKIADLLENDNRFVAKMAYDYLSSINNKEKVLLEKILKYEKELKTNE